MLILFIYLFFAESVEFNFVPKKLNHNAHNFDKLVYYDAVGRTCQFWWTRTFPSGWLMVWAIVFVFLPLHIYPYYPKKKKKGEFSLI